MKKKMIAAAMAVALAASLAACGSSSSSTDTEEEKEYVSEDEIASVLSNPDEYKGKYIVLTGKVFNKVDSNDEEQSFQAYYDTVNYDGDYVVYCPADIDISEDEYVEVDGRINGSVSFKNMLGTKMEALSINADTVTELSYMDVVVPAITEIEPDDVVAQQHDVTVRVDKVEYAETETRIWITMENGSSDTVNIYPSQGKIVQNGTQYDYNWDSMTSYETDEDTPSDSLLPGVSSSGMLVFPAIDSSEEFQLYIENCYSDDYEIQFDPFIITVPAAE